MVDEKLTIQDASEVDPNLLRMLDRGLEDIEAGRTLPTAGKSLKPSQPSLSGGGSVSLSSALCRETEDA